MYIDDAISTIRNSLKDIVGRMGRIEEKLKGIPLEGKGFFVPFTHYDVLGANITAASATPFWGTVGKAMVLQSWMQNTYVDTTNNGSNYWSISLIVKQADQSNDTIATFNTSTHSASANVKTTTSLNSYTILSTDLTLAMAVSKVGSPGGLYIAGPAVYAT